jgi:hypothetical protein
LQMWLFSETFSAKKDMAISCIVGIFENCFL